MIGTVQDVTERRELEREHRIAETLQQALLPDAPASRRDQPRGSLRGGGGGLGGGW